MSELVKGDRVRHVSDPHGRNRGTVVGEPDPARERFLPDLHKVEWDSGMVENVHQSELRKVDE